MEQVNIRTGEATHEKINGQDYKNLIISAACELEKSKGEINDLNVFPVPDGDTGSNMSMTVGNAARELLSDESLGIDETADRTARAMLRGARGNSGVIVSLLFRGIAKSLKNSYECDGVAWAEALNEGVKAAYSAVENPVEGTILSVAKHCAEAARLAAVEKNDFEFVLSVAIAAAEEALEETVYKNPVLERAGVVDAGGMGWLVVMKAMRQALNGTVTQEGTKPIANASLNNVFSGYKTEDITFTYCTEFIIKKHNPNNSTKDFKAYLTGMGDSLVMLDDGELVKVHIHTNEPYSVLGHALKYGEYETVKVENMRTQHTNNIARENKSPVQKNKKYGFVAVSSGKGLEDLFYDLGVDTVVSGGQTMNPSCEEIFKASQGVYADTVFLLPNNKNIIMACEQVKEMSQKKIVVIPTKTVPQGISAMLGFDESQEVEKNRASMVEMAGGVSTFQVTYAARNSSIDGLDIKAGEYLALDNGELIMNSVKENDLIDLIAERIEKSGKSTVSIYYGIDVSDSEAQGTLEQLSKRLPSMEIGAYSGGQPVYRYIISAE